MLVESTQDVVADLVDAGGTTAKAGVLLAKSEPTSPNQMQKQKERGQAPDSVERVDRGRPEAGEQSHVHFKDGRTLNQDGSWRGAGDARGRTLRSSG